MHMKHAAAVLLLLMAACAVSPTSATDSGIRGRATIGPTCPVEQAGQSPCIAAYHGTVVVKQGDKTVTTFKPAADGTFTLNLKPGSYTLESQGVMPTLAPVTVVVRAHAYTTVNLDFDSGIR